MTIASEETQTLLRLRQAVAHRLLQPARSIALIQSFDSAVTTLLRSIRIDEYRLLVVGHATPDLAIAADRAGYIVEEALAVSPFSGSLQPVLDRLGTTPRVIYIANPNLVTGAAFSMSDLDELLTAAPTHLVIVDERYTEFLGVSAFHLLDQYDNLVVLRALTAAPSRLNNPGVVAASPARLAAFQALHSEQLDHAGTTAIETFLAETVLATRSVALIHQELLRVAETFTRLGIQYRLSATDFILFRVASPATVGNALAAARVPVDNLDGYPELEHYLRFRIASPQSTDALIAALDRLDPASYRLASIDKRLFTLRRTAELTGERRTVVERRAAMHLQDGK